MQKFNGKYFATAWADLTQDKRWWQPMLVYALVTFIPIIGSMAVMGYFLDWAKEASWGMKRPLTRQVGDAGRRIKYGFFALVISLVWTLPLSLVVGLVAPIPFVGTLLYVVGYVCIIIAGVLAIVATLRALTYERITPGFQISRIFKMAGKDAGGLVRCWAIGLIGGLIVFLIIFLAVTPVVIFVISMGAGDMMSGFETHSYGYGGMYGYGYGSDDAAALALLRQLLPAFMTFIPLFLIVGYVASFVTVLFDALTYRAYGYWLGQFKPQEWGREQDPMPFEREEMANPYGVPNMGQQPYAGQAPYGGQAPQAGQQPYGGQTPQAGPYAGAQQYGAPPVGGQPGAPTRAEQWEQEFAASQAAAAAAQQDSAIQPAAAEPQPDETPAADVEFVGEARPEEAVGFVEAEEPAGDEPAVESAPEPDAVTGTGIEADAGAGIPVETASEPEAPAEDPAAQVQAEKPKQVGWRSATNASAEQDK